MIRKRKLIIISVLTALALLVMGLVGSQVFAESSTETPAPSNTIPADPQKIFADKVAAILGLDAATVEDAFAQAQKQIQSEALDNHLKQLVDSGAITQDQADAYKTWLESKPDVNIPGLEGGMGLGHGGRMGGPGMGRFSPQSSLASTDPGDSSSSSNTY